MRRLFCALAVLILGCADVSAQESNDNSFYTINGSFYHSEGVLEGESYSFNHLGLDLEKNWDRNKFGLSGWSLGYRKEELNKKHFGHFVNLGVFRRIGVGAGFYVKPGIKIEWGLPSDRFDHTVLDVKVGKTVSIFVFEAGLRGGYPEVVVEKYYISEDEFLFEIDKDRVLIPSAVVTVGLKF